VSELKGLTLVLNFEVLAQIYLNNITMWNDQRIKDINSAEVAAALPAESIIVLTASSSSSIEQLFTYMLSTQVPEFASEVPTTARSLNVSTKLS
jgi:phosphate transport system substrate-binding protein